MSIKNPGSERWNSFHASPSGLVGLALPPHAFDVFMIFVVACVVAHDAMLEFGGNVLKMSAAQAAMLDRSGS